MEIDLKAFNIQEITPHYRDIAIKALLGIDGYNFDRKKKVLTIPDTVTIFEYLASPFKIKGFAVFMEIPNDWEHDIPHNLSWALKSNLGNNKDKDKNSKIYYTWNDAKILIRGNQGNNIVHFGSKTGAITKADCRVLMNADIGVVTKNDIKTFRSNPDSQYYQNHDDMI